MAVQSPGPSRETSTPAVCAPSLLNDPGRSRSPAPPLTPDSLVPTGLAAWWSLKARTPYEPPVSATRHEPAPKGKEKSRTRRYQGGAAELCVCQLDQPVPLSPTLHGGS